MKVVAFNGSPTKEGNTYHALMTVCRELEAQGIETELVQVGSAPVRGCVSCRMCGKNRDEKCVLPDDGVNGYIQKMKEADGILLGSPVHYSGISGTMKCFLDRAFYVCGNNGGILRHKVAASVVAVRRAGGMPAFDTLNYYITYSEMLMPTANYWNVAYGRKPGEVDQDTEAQQLLQVLGRNMAWLLKLVEHGKGAILEPEAVPKTLMNFIR